MSENGKPGLKSAYELAMERMAGQTGAGAPLSNGQKARIAEIENIAKARVAELEILFARKKAQASSDADALALLQREFSEQVAAIRGRADAEKDAVRQEH